MIDKPSMIRTFSHLSAEELANKLYEARRELRIAQSRVYWLEQEQHNRVDSSSYTSKNSEMMRYER